MNQFEEVEPQDQKSWQEQPFSPTAAYTQHGRPTVPYTGNGAYCYANSLHICLAAAGANPLPDPGFLECLTLMPFGVTFARFGRRLAFFPSPPNHDPQGFPFATLPLDDLMAAWRAEKIGYVDYAYNLRHDFRRIEQASRAQIVARTLPCLFQQATGPAAESGFHGGVAAYRQLAHILRQRVPDTFQAALVHFALPLGARLAWMELGSWRRRDCRKRPSAWLRNPACTAGPSITPPRNGGQK